MSPPTWKLVLTSEEGSKFSSRQFKSDLCPCKCCWCGKCGFKQLPEDRILTMLPKLVPLDDESKLQPFWSLVLIFADGSEFPSRPLKPSVGLCRYCWCEQRGGRQIQESDLRAFQSFFSLEATSSLKALLDLNGNQLAGDTKPLFPTENCQENSETSANILTSDSPFEPVLLKNLLLQKREIKLHDSVRKDTDDELFQSGSDEEDESSNVEDADPSWVESDDSDDHHQKPSRIPKPKSLKRPEQNQIHNSKRRYQCDQCPDAFTRSNHLRDHKKVHAISGKLGSGNRPFECDKCQSAFTFLLHLQDHKERVHSSNKIQAVDKQKYRNNEETRTIKKKRRCLECNKTFEDKKALYCHMKEEHNRVLPFKCGLCSSRFRTKNYQIIHQRTHMDKNEKYNCDRCEYSSTVAMNVRNHLLTHSRNKPSTHKTIAKPQETVSGGIDGFHSAGRNSKIRRKIESSAKSSRTATATTAANNRINVLPTSMQNDDQSDSRIVSMGSIFMYESDSSRPFLNDLAGDSTWTGPETGEEDHSYEAQSENEEGNKVPLGFQGERKRLRKRSKVTKLSEPSPGLLNDSEQQPPSKRSKSKSWCFECCKPFEGAASLAQHRKEHNPTHPFKCYLCPARFKTSTEKNTHQQSHKDRTGRYKCSFSKCSYSNKFADTMHKHMRVHTGEKPFQCDECECSFSLLENLTKHNQCHHNHRQFNLMAVGNHVQ